MCISVAVIGRASAGVAANTAAAATAARVLCLIMARTLAEGGAHAILLRGDRDDLDRFPRNAMNLALYMFVHDPRQIVVEPLLEDRTEHLADQFLERIGGGHGRRG